MYFKTSQFRLCVPCQCSPEAGLAGRFAGKNSPPTGKKIQATVGPAVGQFHFLLCCNLPNQLPEPLNCLDLQSFQGLRPWTPVRRGIPLPNPPPSGDFILFASKNSLIGRTLPVIVQYVFNIYFFLHSSIVQYLFL